LSWRLGSTSRSAVEANGSAELSVVFILMSLFCMSCHPSLKGMVGWKRDKSFRLLIIDQPTITPSHMLAEFEMDLGISATASLRISRNEMAMSKVIAG
jgi:hypothetical protein